MDDQLEFDEQKLWEYLGTFKDGDRPTLSEVARWQHSQNQLTVEKLLKFIKRTKNVAEVLEHSIELGQYTAGGSTEGWAIEVLLKYELAKKEVGLE